MGIRLLFVLVVVLLVLWLVRRLLRSHQPPHREISSRMVRCEHCGLHVPADEAVWGDHKSYCCEAHRDADRPD
jgi:uncharacterized protein